MNKIYKIAVIGGGYVGLHTALKIVDAFPYSNVSIYDIDDQKVERWNNGLSPIDDYFMAKFMEENPHKIKNISYLKPNNSWGDFDIYFLALSTNPIIGNEHKLNTDPLFEISKKIKSKNLNSNIFIRSTINITDSNKFLENGIGYWPEFLSQGIETSINLNRKSNTIYIPKDNNFANNFFDELFKGQQLMKVLPQEAIMVKIMHNTLDAHLISITNLLANISEENDIDFSIISPAVEFLLKERNKVKRPGIGFGGSCYPKDSYSLISVTDSKNNIDLIQALENFNVNQSYAFLYKEEIIRKANKIVLLGVSFKGGTNDITRTPTASIRNWLNINDIKYVVWEPMINNKWTLPHEIISGNISKDIEDSDLVIVASDWDEFNELLKNYNKTVIDLKYCIKNNGMMDLHYLGKK